MLLSRQRPRRRHNRGLPQLIRALQDPGKRHQGERRAEPHHRRFQALKQRSVILAAFPASLSPKRTERWV